jgi:glutathione S-transferase
MRPYYSRNLNPRVAVAVARHLEMPIELVRASHRDPKNEDAFGRINPNALVPFWSKKTQRFGKRMR